MSRARAVGRDHASGEDIATAIEFDASRSGGPDDVGDHYSLLGRRAKCHGQRDEQAGAIPNREALVQSAEPHQIIKELQGHRFCQKAETLPQEQMLLGVVDVQQNEAFGEAG